MSVSAKYELKLRADETLTLGLDNVANPVATHEIVDSLGTLTATSTPPATKAWSDRRQLTAGADTFDLTALGNGNLPNVTFSGLKVQLVKIKAHPNNTAGLVFVAGASNGYNLFGDADGSVTLLPADEVVIYRKDTLADVAGGAKTVDVSSSDADAIYDVILVAG